MGRDATVTKATMEEEERPNVDWLGSDFDFDSSLSEKLLTEFKKVSKMFTWADANVKFNSNSFKDVSLSFFYSACLLPACQSITL